MNEYLRVQSRVAQAAMRRWIFAIFCALSVRAQDVPPRYNFLFLIDNSISMADRKSEVITAVRDTIRSGFAGQMQEGDAVEIWTLELNAEPFRVDPWDPKRGGEITSTAGGFLAAQKFHRGNHLNPALARLGSYIETNRNTLVVVLTDGEEMISGLPFDADLNRDMARMRREAARSKRPIIIALTAVDGKLTDWLMKIGTERPMLARLPDRTRAVIATAPEKTEPVNVVELPKAPEPETPAILNLPPGAKIVATVVQPSEEKSKESVRAEPLRNDQERSPVAQGSEAVSTGRTSDASIVQPQRQSPAAVVPIDPPSMTRSAPDDPIAVLASKTNAPSETAPLSLKLITNTLSASEALMNATSGASKPVALSGGEMRAGLNWVYVFASVGGICLGSTGLLLLRRPDAGRRESIISKSLAR